MESLACLRKSWLVHMSKLTTKKVQGRHPSLIKKKKKKKISKEKIKK